MENVVHGDVHADLVYLQQLSLFRNNINISMNMNININISMTISIKISMNISKA